MPSRYPDFYGQHGEDYLLWRFFEGEPSGVFVDVGAYDGIYLSNTYLLEKLGWRGVCVEPLPTAFEWCRANRSGSACYQAACVAESQTGTVVLHADEMGVFSSLEQSGSPHDLGYHYHRLGLDFAGTREVRVPARSLGDILEEEGLSRVDVLSVDTEGTELTVLSGLDLDKVDVRMMLIEANSPERVLEVKAFADRTGYLVARALNINQFLVKEPSDAARLKAIKLQALMVPQTHPLGLQHTFHNLRDFRILDEPREFQIKKLTATVARQEKELEEVKREAARLQAWVTEIHESKSFQVGQMMAKPYRLANAGLRRILR